MTGADVARLRQEVNRKEIALAEERRRRVTAENTLRLAREYLGQAAALLRRPAEPGERNRLGDDVARFLADTDQGATGA